MARNGYINFISLYLKLVFAKCYWFLIFLLGDSCCFPFSLGSVKKFLKKELDNVYVKSIKIGNSVVEDYESGFFIHPNKQVNFSHFF